MVVWSGMVWQTRLERRQVGIGTPHLVHFSRHGSTLWVRLHGAQIPILFLDPYPRLHPCAKLRKASSKILLVYNESVYTWAERNNYHPRKHIKQCLCRGVFNYTHNQCLSCKQPPFTFSVKIKLK